MLGPKNDNFGSDLMDLMCLRGDIIFVRFLGFGVAISPPSQDLNLSSRYNALPESGDPETRSKKC